MCCSSWGCKESDTTEWQNSNALRGFPIYIWWELWSWQEASRQCRHRKGKWAGVKECKCTGGKVNLSDQKRVWTVLQELAWLLGSSLGRLVCEGEWGVTEESRILSECSERAGHSSYQNTQSETMHKEQESINWSKLPYCSEHDVNSKTKDNRKHFQVQTNAKIN